MAALLAALAFLAACQRAPSLADERRSLEAVLTADRQAHLHTDADMLAANLADTLLSIDGGRLTPQPRDAVRRMFGGSTSRGRFITLGRTSSLPRSVSPPTARRHGWCVRFASIEKTPLTGANVGVSGLCPPIRRPMRSATPLGS